MKKAGESLEYITWYSVLFITDDGKRVDIIINNFYTSINILGTEIKIILHVVHIFDTYKTKFLAKIIKKLFFITWS